MTIHKDLNSNISEILKKFYNINDYNIGLDYILKKMVELCKVDRLCLIIKNHLDSDCGITKNAYINALEYELSGNNSIVSYNNLTDVFINTYYNLQDNTDLYKTELLELFKDKLSNNNILAVPNFQEVSKTLLNMNFKSKFFMKNKSLADFQLFFINQENIFAYITIERYNSKFTQEEINIINNMLNIASTRIKLFQETKLFHDEFKMLNVIVKNEKMPIALVEKDTYNILYHNELYKKILPKITTNIKCYTLYGYNDRCPNCYLDDVNNEVQRLESDNNYWIKKSTPIKLSDNRDAYMIYAKDTNDFVKQLEGIDILTNLFSLKGLNDYYNESLIKSDYNYALCTIDIDKFKNINNTFGYSAGNNVLIEISKVLTAFKSNDERCCRLNEDRFAIFMQYDEIEELKEKILVLRNSFVKMQKLKFPDKKITIIGGICLVDKTQDLNILLDKANIARKLSKGSHQSRFAFYDQKLEQEAERERIIEERMFSAVTHEQFIPYLQPKFELETMKICGAEALVRWITPEGMIFPDEFIPLFEKNGFINILDFIIYKKIMIYIRDCLDRGLNIVPISVNVSRGHIQDAKFIDKFIDLTSQYNIPLELLELEVTESVFVEDKDDLKNFIQKLKSQNLKVSIDDFGTAYSSLQTLTDLNIDVLKIDKGFIDNIGIDDENICNRKSNKDEIVIKHVINLAKDLGFDVICEGIETVEQVEILKNLGCGHGQGYLFAKPMPTSEFEENFLK